MNKNIKKIITKKIGGVPWEIIYYHDIWAEMDESEKMGHHVSDWAWQHAYCTGKNLINGDERWLPRNYMDLLLECTARKNFMDIYYSPIVDKDDYRIQLARDFDQIWDHILRPDEKNDFAINQCYTKDKNGKIIVYFHVLNKQTGCYDDIDLDDFREMDKSKY